MSKQLYITTIIRSRRWGYYGHALRMNETKIPKQLTKWNTTGNVRGVDREKPYVEHSREGTGKAMQMQQLTESVRRKWSPPYASA